MESNQNLEVLLSGIRKEAREERERVLSEARAEASRILEEADAKAARSLVEAKRRGERRLLLDQERVRGKARLEESAARLRAARTAIAKAFEIAGDRMRLRCATGEYPSAVKALVRQALESAPGRVEIGMDQPDLEIGRAALKEAGREGNVHPEGGGPGTVIVTSLDGARRVDNSLSVRLSAAVEALESEVVSILIGGADSTAWTATNT